MKALRDHLTASHGMTTMAMRKRLHEERVQNARRFRSSSELGTYLKHKAKEAIARPSPRPYVAISPELAWVIAGMLTRKSERI